MTDDTFTDITGLEHVFAEKDEFQAASPIARRKQAVSYVRVSNVKQLRTAMDIDADGNSLATQREQARHAANKLEADIVQEFVERGRSAQTITSRPSFRALLAYVEDHHEDLDYVIVYARSRAFRSSDDAPEIEARLRRLGIEIFSATETFSEDEDTAKLQKFITDWTNAKTVRDNGRDIATKMLHKAQRGGFNGRAKLGYLNDKVKIDGYFVNTISLDPERAPLIRWAFESYATGEYSLPRLRRELTSLGLQTRETAAFRAQEVSISQLARILRDPHYTGVILYNGNLYPGRHDPIISKELYLRVQDVINGRVRRGLRDRVHHHYLRGLLFCKRCEKNEQISQLVYTESEGNGGTYAYFFCARRKAGECDLPYLSVPEVERAVEIRFGREQLSEGAAQELKQEIASALETMHEAEEQMQKSLRRQLRRLEGQEDRLVALVADGDLPVEKLKERLRNVALERDHLTDRLSRTDTEISRGRETIEEYLDLLARPAALYPEANDAIRRQLLDAVFPKLSIDMHDDLEIYAEPHPAIGVLRAAQALENEQNPHHSVGVRLIRAAELLFPFFRPNGSNKGSLVAGTGFEPATSGL